MAIVPLSECKIPTLIPSPLAAGALGAADDEPDGEAVGVVALGVQALSNTLPAAVEPKIKISRRRNFLAILLESLLRILKYSYLGF
jgi:hypothetical protein